MAFLGLLGCSTEMLKIHVPPTGIDSVHQEDLRRAYWRLERGISSDQWWNSRARQVHLATTQHKGCFVHRGEADIQDSSVLVIAEPVPIQLSMLVSLAKAVDGVSTSEDWFFCVSATGSTPIEAERSINLSQENLGNIQFVDVQFEQLEQRVRQILSEQEIH